MSRYRSPIWGKADTKQTDIDRVNLVAVDEAGRSGETYFVSPRRPDVMCFACDHPPRLTPGGLGPPPHWQRSSTRFADDQEASRYAPLGARVTRGTGSDLRGGRSLGEHVPTPPFRNFTVG
jgi:hypothetical protein